MATTGRPGPVLIDLPKNVQQAQVIPDFNAPMDLPGYRGEKPRAKPEQIRAIAEAIRRAKRPLICCGGGVIASGASQELLELVERATGIPVTSTSMGLGGSRAITHFSWI